MHDVDTTTFLAAAREVEAQGQAAGLSHEQGSAERGSGRAAALAPSAEQQAVMEAAKALVSTRGQGSSRAYPMPKPWDNNLKECSPDVVMRRLGWFCRCWVVHCHQSYSCAPPPVLYPTTPHPSQRPPQLAHLRENSATLLGRDFYASLAGLAVVPATAGGLPGSAACRPVLARYADAAAAKDWPLVWSVLPVGVGSVGAALSGFLLWSNWLNHWLIGYVLHSIPAV